MSPMDYGDGWVNPGKPGLPQARCQSANCTAEGIPGLLVIAATLDEHGRCASCARDADDMDRLLR
jgi:hypothetical protein